MVLMSRQTIKKVMAMNAIPISTISFEYGIIKIFSKYYFSAGRG
jgi:hypothetical protein